MFGLHLLTTAKVNALKEAGHTVAAAATSGLTTAVHLAAQAGNPIGAATLAAVDAAEATGKPGAAKRLAVIAAVAPVIASGLFTAATSSGSAPKTRSTRATTWSALVGPPVWTE